MILTASRGGTYEADKIQFLVLAICEINRKDHRETGDIYDCCSVIVVWGITGPIFGFSDTWQLVINTGTTIITFLMVFLIQNTQNRDSEAMQVKLDELIRATQGAQNALLDLEELEEDELDRIKAGYEEIAEQARGELRR
jgi:low affinity Fe/Cu permease